MEITVLDSIHSLLLLFFQYIIRGQCLSDSLQAVQRQGL